MKIEIEQQKHIQETVTVEVDLPDEIVYYFITGERNSYKVIPMFAKWDDGKLYGYEIIRVGLSFVCEIERYEVLVSNIPDILDGRREKGNSIINTLVNYPEDGVRTKEHFEADLNRALKTIGVIPTQTEGEG